MKIKEAKLDKTSNTLNNVTIMGNCNSKQNVEGAVVESKYVVDLKFASVEPLPNPPIVEAQPILDNEKKQKKNNGEEKKQKKNNGEEKKQKKNGTGGLKAGGGTDDNKSNNEDICACIHWCRGKNNDKNPGSESFPFEFERNLCTMAYKQIEGNKTYYIWDSNKYSESEWKAQIKEWKNKYPKINTRIDGYNDKPLPPHEGFYERKATTQDKVKNDCWLKLPSRVNGAKYSGKVYKFMEQFKIDMYGNVISFNGAMGSLVSFDIDHLFPWCRGGRSVLSNFAAVQSFANQSVKKEHLIQELDPEEMQSGMSYNQLEAIVDHIRNITGKTNRRDLFNFITELERILISSPPSNAPGINTKNSWNFKKEAKGSTNGEFLWNILKMKQKEWQVHMDTKYGLVKSNDDDDEEEDKKNHSNSNTKFRARPRIFLGYGEGRIEIWGVATYQIRESLRKEFKMTWLEEKKSWFLSTLYFPDDEIQSILNEIVVECNKLSIDVIRENIESIESNDNSNNIIINQDPTHYIDPDTEPAIQDKVEFNDDNNSGNTPVKMNNSDVIQTPETSKMSPAITKKGTECKDCVNSIKKHNRLCLRHQKNE